MAGGSVIREGGTGTAAAASDVPTTRLADTVATTTEAAPQSMVTLAAAATAIAAESAEVGHHLQQQQQQQQQQEEEDAKERAAMRPSKRLVHTAKPHLLRCTEWPVGSEGMADGARCALGNSRNDGFRYVHNTARGTSRAACGQQARCACCRYRVAAAQRTTPLLEHHQLLRGWEHLKIEYW